MVVNGGARRRDGDETRLDLQAINRCRELRIDSQLTLFEGTIEDNIVLGQSYTSYSDVRWTLRFTELEENVDAFPQGPSPHSSPQKNSCPDAYHGDLAHTDYSGPCRKF
jgi:ABC-type transport system involved in cytochrome bd biosynthesis fused ATPase/permease subunit